jgi:hypothetical protein
MLIWILLILAVAAALAAGIERLITRLGVRKAEPTQDGLANLAERLEGWSKARMRDK